VLRKRVLAIVLFALVFSFGAFTASAQEHDAEYWAQNGWHFEGTDVFFKRDGVKVTGIQEVPMVAEWWPGDWGPAPATRYYYFDEVTGAVQERIGWQEIGGEWYFFVPGSTLFEGWHWCPTDNTMHYMQPYASTGEFVLTTNIPASWTYGEEDEPGRVTHRWFNFGTGKGALVQDAPTTGWQGDVFFFGHGVTRGWVFDAGNLFFFGMNDAGKPVMARGTHKLIHSNWLNEVRNYTFDNNGRLVSGRVWENANMGDHFNFAVESFLPGITFIIIEEKVKGTFGADGKAFLIDIDGEHTRRENGDGIYPQPGGGWRLAVEGEFVPSDLKLQIFG